ncbi:phospholipase A2 inhibitor and Ly6/PLAUR domain-containing protein [Bombina bombina]|uniref:phospholipase A2 inhibitor and Ly6/PLAUR domain-containing protein n=1 Tax=Bombina bombina TaxID=8345 RepID=UPI00235B06CC|nr:phospholipase A2 inhibitor and Ly6/PLAUR domain-containing protein [Bombina bombina]
MRSVVAILCVLSSLIPQGYSLSCVECFGTSSSCTGSSKTCATGYQCLSTYSVTTVTGGTEVNLFARSCSPASECNVKGSISNPYMKVRVSSSCCSTDNCTPTTPTLPTYSSQQNGLTCRSCISATSDWCYTQETVSCTGDEDRCILQSTNLAGTKTAVRGCATKSICDSASQTSIQGVSVTCSNGSTGLHIGIFLPAFLSLLIIKMIS